MSYVKKKFSLSQNIASGLKNAITSASSNQGKLHFDLMALELIEPDPNNPRKLSITKQDVLNGINDANNIHVKKDEMEGIEELAASIKKVGLRNPIEVYKYEDKYRIMTGERRYLAANLCGLTAIPVRIVQKPNDYDLRYIQWVENLNRRDLNLWEKFGNLRMIADAYEKANQSQLSEIQLRELLGVSKSHAYRYYSLLYASSEILELVKDGTITNLKQIHELSSIKNKNELNEFIVAAKAERQIKDNTGCNKSEIKLGFSLSKESAKYIMELIVTKGNVKLEGFELDAIDWNSSKSAKKALSNLLLYLESKLSNSQANQ